MDTSMKIVILEANALGKDIDLSVFDKLGHVTKLRFSLKIGRAHV